MPTLAQGLLLPRAPTGPVGVAEILQRGAEDIVVLAYPRLAGVTEHVLAVPGGYWYRLLALQVAVVTSAVAATRAAEVLLYDQDGVHALTLGYGPTQGANVGASRAYAVSAQVVTTGALAVSPTVSPLVDVIVPSGWRIRVVIDNAQAGDEIQRPYYIVERYPTAVREPARPPGTIPARLIEQASVFTLAPPPPVEEQPPPEVEQPPPPEVEQPPPEGEQPPPEVEQPPPPEVEQPPPEVEQPPPEGEQPPPEGQPPERPSLPPLPPIQERAVAAEELRRRLEEEAARQRRVPVREPGEIPRGRPLAE